MRDITELKLSPAQLWFFTCTARFILWMGSRGSSKTFCAVNKAFFLCKHIPGFAALLFREHHTEFPNIYDEAKKAIARFGVGRIVENKRQIIFEHHFPPSVIHLAAADSIKTIGRYQGWNVQLICIDEPQRIKPAVLERLFAIGRSTIGGPRVQICLLANAGGPSHRWLRENFIDLAEAKGLHGNLPGRTGIKFEDNVMWEFPHINPDGTSVDKAVIRSNMTANEALDIPEYIATLGILNNKLWQMWVKNRWDLIEGAFFEGVMNCALSRDFSYYDRVYCGMDPGYNVTGVLWAAASGGHKGKKPVLNVFDAVEYLNLTPDAIAEKMKRRHPALYTGIELPSGDIIKQKCLHIMDQAAWGSTQTHGKEVTVASMYGENGIHAIPAAQISLEGKTVKASGCQVMQNEFFRADDGGTVIHPVHGLPLINALTGLVFDDNNPFIYEKDKDIDHLPDAYRYLVTTARFRGKKPEKQYIQDLKNDPRTAMILEEMVAPAAGGPRRKGKGRRKR